MKIGPVRTAVAVRGRPDGRHDRHGVPPPREAARRLRARRHRDGELRGARARHRPDARVRRIHRGRAADLDPDLRRRPRQDGGGRADRRRHGRRHRRRQHGLPGAEDRQAQRRLQPDARAGACRQRDRGDGEGREDSGDGEDARRLERRRAERRRRWRGWSRMPAPRRLPCTAGPPRRATAARRTGISSRGSPTA